MTGLYLLNEPEGWDFAKQDGRYIIYTFSSIGDYFKFHGYSKKEARSFARQFMIPGNYTDGIWCAPKDQFEEWLKIVSKWGADYKPDKESGFIRKKDRKNYLKKELTRAKLGKLKVSRPWNPLGGY